MIDDDVYSLKGQHQGGQHTPGRAIDVNYEDNSYFICTRGNSVGGESGGPPSVGRDCLAALVRVRDSVHAACDVSPRAQGESYGNCWERWHETSEAIVEYLRPLQGENLPIRITSAGASAHFSGTFPNASSDPALTQLISDFHALRKPLVIGAPNMNPALTRNPAIGIMDIPKNLVVGLMASGLKRWGAADFGTESGDIMHFDLGRG